MNLVAIQDSFVNNQGRARHGNRLEKQPLEFGALRWTLFAALWRLGIPAPRPVKPAPSNSSVAALGTALGHWAAVAFPLRVLTPAVST